MGRARNEMMPQPNSRIAMITTRKRLFSAKSTKPRIMGRSLPFGVLQDEGVLHHALARLNARSNLLHIAGEHVSAGHFHAPELSVGGGQLFIGERVITVRKAGWRAMLLSALLLPELAYDWF